jgi:thiamine-monophosphate kinase
VNEKELVARVRELFSDRIGDDGAVIGDQVLTTDMLVEDIDFTRGVALHAIGRKSLAVNLSDLAAMGAAPQYALVALGVPEWAMPNLDDLLTALAGAAREHRIEIVGGDFSRAEKLTIAITAVGRIETRPLLRSGARPGDRVYLSRPVGGSAAGLQLLSRDNTRGGYAMREFIESAIRRHVDPQPELALGRKLAAIPEVTACTDVSDGLSTDLHHLCDASQCGAEIERERIPIFPDLLNYGPALGIRTQDAVLHGGEEYALLFTSTLRESELSRRVGQPVYLIGKMTAEREVVLKENGLPRTLSPDGYDHFRA